MTDGRVDEIRFPHSCNGKIIVISSDDEGGCQSSGVVARDISREMAEETDTLALQQVSVLPSQIWSKSDSDSS
ncbi:hypothetical protein PI125_g13562 [Phytophthora idaei]|nr:hypothetical protein PI125_g13562 [Phytophthora idaei]